MATAIARTSNAFGRAIAFFFGPALVANAADMPRFLYVVGDWWAAGWAEGGGGVGEWVMSVVVFV
jgi:hypothetical protein